MDETMNAQQAETLVRQKLSALQDLKYREFHASLIPTVRKETVIGVRTPALRALAKDLRGTAAGEAFLQILPHEYYEEQALHAMLIEHGDFETVLRALERFLPTIDNWAICDLLRVKVFAGHEEELMPHILRWLHSGRTYVVRFGIRMLMDFYLGKAFCPAYLKLAADCACGDYYIDMCVAWYFAEALCKQPEAAMPWFEQKLLPKWTHNKAIQKSVESFRIPQETKDYLRTLRIKGE